MTNVMVVSYYLVMGNDDWPRNNLDVYLPVSIGGMLMTFTLYYIICT